MYIDSARRTATRNRGIHGVEFRPREGKMELAEKCRKCAAPFGKLDNQVCGRCGWDSQIGMRKCVKCKNAVVLNEKLGYGPIGGLAGVSGFLLWFFLGPLLGGA